MKIPTLGSILLGSTDPARLHAWYQAALAPEHSPDGFMIFGGISVLIDSRNDIGDTNREPGRVILNFHVDDARATAAHLNTLGVSWLVELEARDDGLFGTLIDPDGNYIQIIQFTEEYHERQKLG
jgi:Glyoxalase-like domain